MNINKLLRKNISNLKPYSSARSEFKGEASVFLDANENPFNAPFNRYPDPLQAKLKAAIAAVKGVPTDQIFLGNGSDEPIDLLYRAFCEPRIDNVVAIDPTYGMYKVCADINDVEYRKVLLQDNFDFTANELLKATDENSKIIWLCSPNNPTGNSLNSLEIENTLKDFHGIVVVDEAYIDFSAQPSFLKTLNQYPNLVVLQTLSKAWGSAAIRLGMAFASPEIIQVLSNIKYPYNINILTQEQALRAIQNKAQVEQWVETLMAERKLLIQALKQLPLIKHIYPTDANFVLVKVDDANAMYQYLVKNSIIVRNRNTVSLCAGCIRITVGTPEENAALLESLRAWQV
jgi:histidinol-phosphate aminotransferase